MNTSMRGDTIVPLLDGKDYFAFDLEWKDGNKDDNGIGNNRTIYVGAFADNHGNQKVLSISENLSQPPAKQLRTKY